VDVNIYSSSPGDAAPLIGNHENTEVGAFIADYLSLDLERVTARLKKTRTSPGAASSGNEYPWMGEPLHDEVVVDDLDNYHGDFKRLLRKRGPDSAKRSASSCGCGH
jgi:alkaline phosphatase